MRVNLKKLRNDKNLTVEELAQILNISSSHLYKIEAGTRNPNMKLAKKIADYFGEDLGKIFFDGELDDTSIKANLA